MRSATAGLLLGVVAATMPLGAQDTAPNRRTVTIVARDGRFDPDRIEAVRDDLITIHLRSEGTPHSFAIDAYRLMKRAGAGETVTFQFRADQVGEFVYYCSLSTDPQCANMKGTLVVAER